LKIVNCMFGAGLGGLEQVFVDYSEALRARGHDVVHLVAPRAMVIPRLEGLGFRYIETSNFNQYDVFAMWRIRRLLRSLSPDVVIAHGNRAINLVKPAAKSIAPLVAVNHSIRVGRTIGADFAIAINEDMRRRLIEAGQPEARVFKVFNMIRPPARTRPVKTLSSPPVIGAMGRFVPKKGFEKFIEALALLKSQGVSFKATLAGDGDLAPALKALASSQGLGEALRFPGWITDKEEFFRDIDIFCFTSNHDVCPLVLLEAFVYAKPVVLSDSPGPREISTDGVDSLLFPIDDATALAERIRRLIENPNFAQGLASAAQRKILDHHTIDKGGEQLDSIIRRVVAQGSERRR
jgi:glycosyltransferase involved in cell wall biosynthesis